MLPLAFARRSAESDLAPQRPALAVLHLQAQSQNTKKQVDGLMFDLSSVEDQLEAGYPEEVTAVVGDRWSIVEQRRRCDPGIRRLDPTPGCLGGDHHVCPLAAKVWAGRHNRESLNEEPQPVNALGTPAVQERPTLKFGDGHEGDAAGATGYIRFIKLPDRMIFEEERKNVGVDDDLGHAAGSVCLRPRHS